MTWLNSAACLDADPDLFYSQAGEGTTGTTREAREAKAIAICHACPQWVRDECLRDALDHGDTWGIRAGHTPDELEQLAKVARTRRKPGPKPARPKPAKESTGRRAAHHFPPSVIGATRLA